jgi:cephalosporin hydroxylase
MAAATRSRPRESVIHVSVDRRPARTRHPHAVALDAAVEIATVLMLLEEGLEWVEQGHATVVEHTLLDDLVRPQQD